MKKIVSNDENSQPTATPITTEGRENELISLAYDLVKKRLIEGTATSQETVHFLRMGSANNRLQMKVLEGQKELNDAKAQTIKSAEHTEELYNNAIEAMKRYGGNNNEQ